MANVESKLSKEITARQQKRQEKQLRKELKAQDIPLERYAILQTDAYKEGESIIFCSNCDCQFQPGTESAPEDGQCPNCKLAGKLRFVNNNQKLRDTIATIRARLDPQRWEANYAMLMQLAAERRARLPDELQALITDRLSGMRHKVVSITARNQDFADPEFSRRLRQLHLTILGALLDVCEATLQRDRIKLAS